MARKPFQFSFSSARDAHELPHNFKFLEVLGAGSFGKVLKCLKKDTNETVAIKIPKFLQKDDPEVKMMEKLMGLKMDKHNIVQFFGCFNTRCGKAMVFESLDISLESFMLQRHCAPMLLSDVRTVIEQLATAFDALRHIGVIHCDLKPDNVMMVDHRSRPYKVKLIDFGLAMHQHEVKQGMTLQVPCYRAPEVILGLPFSSPIDMWSLGCLMAFMLHGDFLLRGGTEYEVLLDIITLLGMPAGHLLNLGLKTPIYFTQTRIHTWRLKTHQEYCRTYRGQPYYYAGMGFRLESYRKLRLEKMNQSEAVQRAQCIDLLEAMLCLDEAKRIKPEEIFSHPFINSSNKNKEELSREKKTTRKVRPLPPLPSACKIRVRPADTNDKVLMDTDKKISTKKATVSRKTKTTRSSRPLPPPPAPCEMDTEEEISMKKEKRSCKKKTTRTVRPLPPLPAPCEVQVLPPDTSDTVLKDSDEVISKREKRMTVRRLPPLPASCQMDIEEKIRKKKKKRGRKKKKATVRPLPPPPAPCEVMDVVEEIKLPVETNNLGEDGEDTTAKSHDCAGTQKTTEPKRKNCIRRLFSWMKRTFGA